MSFHRLHPLLLLLILAGCSTAGGQQGAQQPRLARLGADGSITIPRAAWMAPSPTQSLRFRFGLPRVPPVAQGTHPASPALLQTVWEIEGIRYTQAVLCTQLQFPDGVACPVLLVQITGENLASEYHPATAALSVEADGQPILLAMIGDLVPCVGGTTNRPLALVDIPATGIAEATGPSLRFGGNMPPGSSGSMTVKIPLAPLEDAKKVEELRLLDFTEEMRRLTPPGNGGLQEHPWRIVFAAPAR